jgi:hypothetical protein
MTVKFRPESGHTKLATNDAPKSIAEVRILGAQFAHTFRASPRRFVIQIWMRLAKRSNHALHRIRAPLVRSLLSWIFHRFLSAPPLRPARIGELGR